MFIVEGKTAASGAGGMRETPRSSGEKRTLDDQVGPENTHGGDTNTGLGGTVGGTEAGEDDG